MLFVFVCFGTESHCVSLAGLENYADEAGLELTGINTNNKKTEDGLELLLFLPLLTKC